MESATTMQEKNNEFSEALNTCIKEEVSLWSKKYINANRKYNVHKENINAEMNQALMRHDNIETEHQNPNYRRKS